MSLHERTVTLYRITRNLAQIAREALQGQPLSESGEQLAHIGRLIAEADTIMENERKKFAQLRNARAARKGRFQCTD